MRLNLQARIGPIAGTDPRPRSAAERLPPGARRAERGSAVLVVFILLTVMSVIVASNGLALHHLNREIQLTEARQKRRLEAQTPMAPPPAAPSANRTTNAVPVPRPSRR